MECRRLSLRLSVLGAGAGWVVAVGLMVLSTGLTSYSYELRGWALVAMAAAIVLSVVASLEATARRLLEYVMADHQVQLDAVQGLRGQVVKDLLVELDVRDQEDRVERLVPRQRS